MNLGGHKWLRLLEATLNVAGDIECPELNDIEYINFYNYKGNMEIVLVNHKIELLKFVLEHS